MFTSVHGEHDTWRCLVRQDLNEKKKKKLFNWLSDNDLRQLDIGRCCLDMDNGYPLSSEVFTV